MRRAMLFKKEPKAPESIKTLDLTEWYTSLDDKNRMKLSRYIDSADSGSRFSFFTTITKKALEDDNPRFAIFMCQQAYEVMDLTDYQMFQVNELIIDAYIGDAKYEDAKAACNANLELFPKIREDFLEDNGGVLPKKINFRNRYIDVIIGIDCAYDLGFEMLDKYNQMGILDDDELEYRKNSLRTHRLQKLFDSVYTYRPEGEDH